ncbi:dodecin [Hansschlegelia beijingensis]|uniref:dodecin n=1 Tax=Hansschlegelia beijingensis TaxID=1133344 RepID=UPI00382EA11A
MSKHTYKVIELVGSSPDSIEDAIRSAISDASRTIRHIGWFEVVETRGHVENGQVAHFQVVLKIGFTIDHED